MRPGFLTACALLAGSAVWGQSVISAHSGIVHYVEGAVTIDGTITDPKFGEFPDIKNGQMLATEEGRAEILLTPGVFLRLAENSSVRMISNALPDTRLEIVSGSALVEVGELLPDNALTFRVGKADVSLPKKGLYRFDASPARLQVEEGQAIVTSGGEKLTAKKGHEINIDADKLADAKFDTKDTDPFYRWSSRRSGYIASANVISAKVADQSGYSSGLAGGNSSWSWNPYYGMFTYLPGNGVYLSPFGYAFYSPGAIWSYSPQIVGTYPVAAVGVPTSSGARTVASMPPARTGIADATAGGMGRAVGPSGGSSSAGRSMGGGASMGASARSVGRH